MMHADMVQPAAGAAAAADLAAAAQNRFQCELCGKSFRQKRTLANHHLSHSGQRPYECKVCNKRFFWSGSLSRHNRIHTGEKPYKCSVCQKQFTQSGTLNRHLRTHTGEKPYLCKYCPRRFSTNSNLAQHLRTHKKNGTLRTNVTTASASRSHADAVDHILAAEYAKPAVVATAVSDSSLAAAKATAATITESASRMRNSGGHHVGVGTASGSSIAWNRLPSSSATHKLPLPLPLPLPPPPPPPRSSASTSTSASLPLASLALQPPLASKLDESVGLNMEPFPSGPEMASLGQVSGMPYFNASTLTMEPLGSLTPTHTPQNPKSPVVGRGQRRVSATRSPPSPPPSPLSPPLPQFKALPSVLTLNSNHNHSHSHSHSHSPNHTAAAAAAAAAAANGAASLRGSASPRSNPLRLWDMEKNVVVGGDGMFECMWCNVRCPQREQLLNHFLTHFGEIS